MPTSSPPPAFEIVTTTLGVTSIRDNRTREIMHNPVGPWAEANALYIDQSDLKKRLLEKSSDELVVFDVGLGAAANALATLTCARGLPLAARRKLHLISYERELGLLRFALAQARHFPHFAGYENAIEALLAEGSWREDGVHWELRHGDFLDSIAVEADLNAAHLIYFDPYSPAKNTEMWTEAAFAKLFAKSRQEALLLTYSRATPVRVAMLRAGFFVGRGEATGSKDETTQAATRLADLKAPLGAEWLGRWQRSHLYREEDRPFILNHPQFRT